MSLRPLPKASFFERAWDWLLRQSMSFYPPFIGAGIRVPYISKDFRTCRVHMNLRFYNQNLVGVHFGGSLYSMCDPFFMLILVKNLGRDYIIWDKAANIRYKKPGRTRVTAEFQMSEEELQRIQEWADREGKIEFPLSVDIKDEEGDVVAIMEKILYVRRKDAPKPPSAG